MKNEIGLKSSVWSWSKFYFMSSIFLKTIFITNETIRSSKMFLMFKLSSKHIKQSVEIIFEQILYIISYYMINLWRHTMNGNSATCLLQMKSFN